MCCTLFPSVIYDFLINFIGSFTVLWRRHAEVIFRRAMRNPLFIKLIVRRLGERKEPFGFPQSSSQFIYWAENIAERSNMSSQWSKSRQQINVISRPSSGLFRKATHKKTLRSERWQSMTVGKKHTDESVKQMEIHQSILEWRKEKVPVECCRKAPSVFFPFIFVMKLEGEKKRRGEERISRRWRNGNSSTLFSRWFQAHSSLMVISTHHIMSKGGEKIWSGEKNESSFLCQIN